MIAVEGLLTFFTRLLFMTSAMTLTFNLPGVLTNDKSTLCGALVEKNIQNMHYKVLLSPVKKGTHTTMLHDLLCVYMLVL